MTRGIIIGKKIKLPEVSRHSCNLSIPLLHEDGQEIHRDQQPNRYIMLYTYYCNLSNCL